MIHAQQPTCGNRAWLRVPALRHPWAYLTFITISALDIIMTWLILAQGGIELNPIAALVIETWGLSGTVAFKFSLALFVIVVCEEVGRHRKWEGFTLALLAIAVSSVPVVYSLTQIWSHEAMPGT
jgi:hypothetical protein